MANDMKVLTMLDEVERTATINYARRLLDLRITRGLVRGKDYFITNYGAGLTELMFPSLKSTFGRTIVYIIYN